MTFVTPRLAESLIASAARRIVTHEDELSRLDAVAGDGDHGVNMVAAFTEAEARVAEQSASVSPADVFSFTSAAFLDTVGGAAGALFGAFFNGTARSLQGIDNPSASQFVAALDQGLTRLVRVGNTELGQKTMLDALDPALRAARDALDNGEPLASIIDAAATAASEGAAATAAMRPTAGRAKYAAKQSTGTADPGATTVSLMFAAWAEVLTSEVAQ